MNRQPSNRASNLPNPNPGFWFPPQQPTHFGYGEGQVLQPGTWIPGNPAQQLLPLAPQQMNYAGSLPPTIPHPQMANYGQQIMPSAQNQPIYLGHPMPPPTPAQPVMLPESFVNGLTSTGFFNQNWQLGATIPAITMKVIDLELVADLPGGEYCNLLLSNAEGARLHLVARRQKAIYLSQNVRLQHIYRFTNLLVRTAKPYSFSFPFALYYGFGSEMLPIMNQPRQPNDMNPAEVMFNQTPSYQQGTSQQTFQEFQADEDQLIQNLFRDLQDMEQMPMQQTQQNRTQPSANLANQNPNQQVPQMQQPVENLPAGRHPNQQQYHQQQVPPTQQSAENLAAGRQPNQQQYQQQQNANPPRNDVEQNPNQPASTTQRTASSRNRANNSTTSRTARVPPNNSSAARSRSPAERRQMPHRAARPLSLVDPLNSGSTSSSIARAATPPSNFQCEYEPAPTPPYCVGDGLTFRQIDHQLPILEVDMEIIRSGSCSICQKPFIIGSLTATITPCSHFYHFTCLRGWCLRSKRCPNCQFDISMS